VASEAQDTLYRIFSALSGVTGSVGGGVIGAAVEAMSGSGSGAAASGSKGSSAGSTAESIAMDVLKSGLGMVPLVTTLFGLFGGGAEAPAPLVKYALPERMNFQAAETASGLANVDYDQTGMPRPYGAADGPAAAPAPQVQVTVNAMDARSFLDRSSEIAAAVREAMLNLNSINDVVNEL
jgi:hypothetical protein